MLESSLFTSGEGFVFHRSGLWNTHKSSDLSAAGNEEDSKGGHVVLALKHLLFFKKKQAWAGAFRVYIGPDKHQTTGRDRETRLCLCSKVWASWMFIWLSEEGFRELVSLESGGERGHSGRYHSIYKGYDCSHEIKRCLLHGRKLMTNIDSILRSRDIT